MKYIMLTGHRKSGTTLLHKLFDSHPYLNVYPVDLTVLYAYYPKWIDYNLEKLEKTKRFAHVVRNSFKGISNNIILKNGKKFDPEEYIKIIIDKYEIDSLNTVSSLIKAIADGYCTYMDFDRSLPFLFKETSQAINLTNMLEDNLNILTIQIIRDPRDNYAAIKAGVKNYYSKYDENELESLSSLLNRARLDLELAAQFMKSNSKNFSVVKYEDLVANPEKELKKIQAFLKIEWSPNMLVPTIAGQDFHGNTYDRRATFGISKESVGCWPSRIKKEEALVIEAWMSAVMSKFKYKITSTNKEQKLAMAVFYAWYNTRYFYRDSYMELV